MLRLAKAFLDIALWRQTPAQLPASTFLLALVACLAALLEVLEAALMPDPIGRLLPRIALAVGLPLLFVWVVLRLAGRPHRFLQTSSALLGVAVLAELLTFPLDSLVSYIGTDRIAALPFGLLLFMGVVGFLFACVNIWRAALDAGIVVGAVVSIGYLLLSMALEQQLLQG